jgi:hypothetical protein
MGETLAVHGIPLGVWIWHQSWGTHSIWLTIIIICGGDISCESEKGGGNLLWNVHPYNKIPTLQNQYWICLKRENKPAVLYSYSPLILCCVFLNTRLPTIQQEVQQRKLLYMGLYLLIWGEAANLRFMPECLCYIYHHVWCGHIRTFSILSSHFHSKFSVYLAVRCTLLISLFNKVTLYFLFMVSNWFILVISFKTAINYMN